MYKKAYEYLVQIEGYEDSDQLLKECAYNAGIDCLIECDYDKAKQYLAEVIFDEDFFNEAPYLTAMIFEPHSHQFPSGEAEPVPEPLFQVGPSIEFDFDFFHIRLINCFTLKRASHNFAWNNVGAAARYKE